MRSAARLIRHRAARFPRCYRIGKEGELAFLIPDKDHYTNFFRLLDRMQWKDIRRERVQDMAAYARIFITIRLRVLEDVSGVESRLSQEVLGLMRQNPHACLLFDLSGEAVCNEGGVGEAFRAFHRVLRRLELPAQRIYFINANASAEFYPEWSAKHSPDYRIHLVGYHFYIYAIMQKMAAGTGFKAILRQLQQAAHACVATGEMRPKRFMSLNLKARPHRVALLLQLISRNYLPDGVVTYIGDSGGEWNDIIAEMRALLSKVPDGGRFQKEIGRLESMRPITYECDAQKVKGIWRSPADIRFLVPEFRRYQGKARIDTYFEIVTETYFSDASTLYITEKTLRPILRFQPFIHLGSPFVLRELQRMGFKTFAPLIDESYDEITDPAQRMQAIMAQIDRLCAMPMQELHDACCAMWEVLEHNFNNLITHFATLYEADVQRNILAPFKVLA